MHLQLAYCLLFGCAGDAHEHFNFIARRCRHSLGILEERNEESAATDVSLRTRSGWPCISEAAAFPFD